MPGVYQFFSFYDFPNKSRKVPIRRVPDDAPGVCYGTAARSWKDKHVFAHWLRERSAMSPLSNGKNDYFHGNAAWHAESEEVQQAFCELNTELRKLPVNASDLWHPEVSFIFQKIKTVRRKLWNKKRMEIVSNDERIDWNSGSGKLPNPGKTLSLKLKRNCA